MTARRGPGRPRKSEEAKASERASILGATRLAVEERGPEVSLDDIASAAGVSKPAIYSHFADKAGLAEALALELEGDLYEWSARRAAENDLHEAADLLRVGVDAFTRFMAEQTNLYRFIVRAMKGNGADVLDNALVPAFQGRITTIVARAYPDLDPDVRETAAFALLGQVFTACEAWLGHRRFPRQQLVELLVELFTGGLPALAGPQSETVLTSRHSR